MMKALTILVKSLTKYVDRICEKQMERRRKSKGQTKKKISMQN